MNICDNNDCMGMLLANIAYDNFAMTHAFSQLFVSKFSSRKGAWPVWPI
jgi:hypothetical protein